MTPLSTFQLLDSMRRRLADTDAYLAAHSKNRIKAAQEMHHAARMKTPVLEKNQQQTVERVKTSDTKSAQRSLLELQNKESARKVWFQEVRRILEPEN